MFYSENLPLLFRPWIPYVSGVVHSDVAFCRRPHHPACPRSWRICDFWGKEQAKEFFPSSLQARSLLLWTLLCSHCAEAYNFAHENAVLGWKASGRPKWIFMEMEKFLGSPRSAGALPWHNWKDSYYHWTGKGPGHSPSSFLSLHLPISRLGLTGNCALKVMACLSNWWCFLPRLGFLAHQKMLRKPRLT